MKRGTSTKKKMHLVSWDKIFTLRENGGLGLRKIRQVNEAFFNKGKLEIMCSTWNKFCGYIIWRVGDGKSIRFWKDNQISSGGRLVEVSTNNVLEHDFQKMVANYMNPNRGWMINKFIDYLPSNVVLQIVNGVIPQQSDMSDIMAQSKISDGEFSTQSKYKVVSNPLVSRKQVIFKAISKWEGPKCFKGFLWKINHECVLTNVRRMCFGMSSSNICTL